MKTIISIVLLACLFMAGCKNSTENDKENSTSKNTTENITDKGVEHAQTIFKLIIY